MMGLLCWRYDNHDAGSRYNYLITDDVNGSLEEATAILTQVGAMLERGGVLYHFELHDDDAPDGFRVIEHPDC